MKQAEKIVGIAIILLMVLRLCFTFPFAASIIALLMLVLSLLYLFLSFGLLNMIRLKNLFKKESYKGISNLRMNGSIVTGFVFSLIVIASLYKFQRWPYGNYLLYVGLICLVPIIAVVIFKYYKQKSSFYKSLLVRLSIISFVGTLLFVTSWETILEMKFRKHPDYIEAVKNQMEDPENEELNQKVYEEQIKMGSSI